MIRNFLSKHRITSNLRLYIFLFILGLGVNLLVGIFQTAPGYMDADYYSASGRALASGYGFYEPFLWNYLDNPQGLPHPAYTYWMPLAGLLSALGMKISGAANFQSGRIGFLLLAGLIPSLTASLAYPFVKQRWAAALSGLLAVFPGFYLAYLPTTDTFGLYMVLGILWLKVTGDKLERSNINPFERLEAHSATLQPFLLGLLAGLMHLARADGLMFLFVGLVAMVLSPANNHHPPEAVLGRRSRITIHASRLSLLLLGYFLIITPWMCRNLFQFGTLLAPGGGKTFWLADYDELFAYPASILTPERWLSYGIGAILRARGWALGQNIQTMLAVQGEIFLVPLALIGMWRMRRERCVQLGGLAYGLTLLAMTLIFPFQGARGGLFHSGAALQPLIWVMAVVGLVATIDWGVSHRNWNPSQARMVLGVGLVLLASLLTILTTYPKVIGREIRNPAWGQAETAYVKLELALIAFEAQEQSVVLVNNPPAYNLVSDRPAIVIPDGDLETTLSVARRYGAEYLLLEGNHPRDLDDLYLKPGNLPGLIYLGSVERMHIFKIPLTD